MATKKQGEQILKDYYLVLEVPDDFDPENLGIELDYPGDISIKSEGNISTLKLLACTKEDVSIPDNGVAIFKFDDSVHPEEAKLVMQYIEEVLHIPALGLCNDVDVLIENADEAVKMLEGMIEKIKSASIRKKILQK